MHPETVSMSRDSNLPQKKSRRSVAPTRSNGGVRNLSHRLRRSLSAARYPAWERTVNGSAELQKKVFCHQDRVIY